MVWGARWTRVYSVSSPSNWWTPGSRDPPAPRMRSPEIGRPRTPRRRSAPALSGGSRNRSDADKNTVRPPLKNSRALAHSVGNTPRSTMRREETSTRSTFRLVSCFAAPPRAPSGPPRPSRGSWSELAEALGTHRRRSRSTRPRSAVGRTWAAASNQPHATGAAMIDVRPAQRGGARGQPNGHLQSCRP